MADVTLLERMKIQAEVLVPMVKAFQKEVGAERAKTIARDALRKNRGGHADGFGG